MRGTRATHHDDGVDTISFRTRGAGPDDAPTLAAIRVASWRAGYAGVVPDEVLDALDVDHEATRWTAILRDAAAQGMRVEFVADRRDVVVGYAAVGPYRGSEVDQNRPVEDDPPTGELGAFYLHPDAWGSGAADQLIHRAEALLAESGHTEPVLWVFEANARARRFYERHGWTFGGMASSIAFGDVHPVDLRYRKNLTS
jgi:GNAT superfamily N-acetyltransferase